MAITNGYATLSEFKNYKNTSSTDATDDGVIEKLIEGSSRFIDNETNQFFYADTDGTKYYTPEIMTVLFVDNLYEVTSIKTDADGDRTYEDTWASTDYDLMPLNADTYSWIEITPEGDYTFPLLKKSVEIVGNWGHESIPDDIRMACLEISHAALGRRSGQNLTGVAEVTGAGVVISPQDITPFARKILQSYVRFR